MRMNPEYHKPTDEYPDGRSKMRWIVQGFTEPRQSLTETTETRRNGRNADETPTKRRRNQHDELVFHYIERVFALNKKLKRYFCKPRRTWFGILAPLPPPAGRACDRPVMPTQIRNKKKAHEIQAYIMPSSEEATSKLCQGSTNRCLP